jgi:fibronectin-binding autotransporter adhesin
MLGQASSSLLQTARRERLVVVAVLAAIIGLWALAPGQAHAAGCTDEWTNTAGGSWFTGSDWSKNAPPSSEEEACITANGTYTVTMTQTSGTVTVRSLTVGGTSGTQTLAVGSSCSVNAILTTTSGIANGAQGAITLTNGESCATNVTLVGPISNAGTITSEPSKGGSRSLQGEITNTGTLAIDVNTAYNGASTLLSNKGAIDLAEGTQLAVAAKNSVTNGTGGLISATGTANILLSSATFTEAAGKTSGTKPVIVDDGTVSYVAGGGKSLIGLRGSSALSGSLVAGQSLSIESTCGENAVATAGASFTNAGAITLTSGESCATNDTLTVSAGTLTNSGTLTTEVAKGGARTLQGSITNTGTLAIDTNTAYNGAGAVLTNEGETKIPEATQLTVSNAGSVVNASGKIAATGSGDVVMDSGTSFTEGAGTTSGTQPVIVDDGTLHYTGSGKSQIAVRGSSSLTGSLGAEQALSLQSTCGENVVATATASFTNAGAITLTNGEGCATNDTLAVSAGTLTNSGKIVTELAIGGARTLQGNITNTGKLTIKATTAYNGENGLLTNEGEISLAEGTQLTVSNKGAVANGAGGKIFAAGTADVLMDSGTSFTQGAGTISGTKAVIVDDGALSYTGSGAGLIALRGTSTLSGSLVAGQLLSIESTCGENAVATVGSSLTNAGAITLTNGDGCGNNATLTVSPGATLTNSGKLVTEHANGGSRTLQGNIANTGTITINTNTAYDDGGAVLTNGSPGPAEAEIALAEGTQLTVTGGGSIVNGPGGKIFGAGTAAVFVTGGTFTEGAGKTNGTQPVIVDDGTLDYTEHGSGPIALRGTSTLNGTVRTGEVLSIQSTCGENASVSAGSFNNVGTLELTNGDGCANNVTLNLKGGTLNNNGGTLISANPHGGSRTIEGNVTSSGSLVLDAGVALHVTGTYTQTSAGRLRELIASSSSFGSLSASGAVSLAGLLVVRQQGFKASAGQKYAIVSGASLTGTFASETEDQINTSGLYYQPTYSGTAATLVVTQATLALSTKSGLPGSSVTVSGGGYLPGDTITPTFTDSKGVVTTFPSVVTNSSGEYSTEITIPAGAAGGASTIKVTSALTGVRLSDPFKVT